MDGNKRSSAPDVEDASTDANGSLSNNITASGALKRKTSGDSGDEAEEEDEGESETKKLKA